MDITPTENEQQIKRPSLFVKMEDGTIITIKSKLIRLNTHYIDGAGEGGKGLSTICKGDDCEICNGGNRPRVEFYYFGHIINKDGEFDDVIQLPASVFFDMNETERLTKKDKRTMTWIIGKTGQGKETRYKAVKNEEVKIEETEVTANTEKLITRIKNYAAKLEDSYNTLVAKKVFGGEKVEDIVIPDEVPSKVL